MHHSRLTTSKQVERKTKAYNPSVRHLFFLSICVNRQGFFFPVCTVPRQGCCALAGIPVAEGLTPSCRFCWRISCSITSCISCFGGWLRLWDWPSVTNPHH